MRSFGFVLAAFGLTALTATAQPPRQQAPPPAAPAADPKIDEHLGKWEAAMKKVETLGAQLTRVDKDPTYDSVQKLTGVAYYMKVGTGASAQNLAMLDLKLDGRKESKEKYICTGTYIYTYAPDQKEIRYYELPKPKPGQVADDSLMSLMFGMRAEEAKRRYDLKIAKEDMNFIYVDIAPRLEGDKADFVQARLILNRSNYLPRQLWFKHANSSEVLWDIPNLQVGMDLNRRAFDAPQAPPGWKIVAGDKRAPTVRQAPPTPPAGR
jgi:TIGR03009 family protein